MVAPSGRGRSVQREDLWACPVGRPVGPQVGWRPRTGVSRGSRRRSATTCRAVAAGSLARRASSRLRFAEIRAPRAPRLPRLRDPGERLRARSLRELRARRARGLLLPMRAGSAHRAAAGAWRRVPCTSRTRSCPPCRSASGCSPSPTRRVSRSPATRRSAPVGSRLRRSRCPNRTRTQRSSHLRPARSTTLPGSRERRPRRCLWVLAAERLPTSAASPRPSARCGRAAPRSPFSVRTRRAGHPRRRRARTRPTGARTLHSRQRA
jgi:hypothetical protein